MGCDGSQPVNLTNNAAVDKQPSWGGGGRLVFSSNRDSAGGFDVYLLTLSPWGIARLTTNAADDESPALSPDGSKVAFVSYRDGDAEIYVMTISDKSVVKITDNTAKDLDPAWSPDGANLVFASDRDGDFDIYTVKADGSGLANISDSGDNARWPDWGVDVFDDEFIVFASDGGGKTTVYLMDSDGSGKEKVSVITSADGQPALGPVAEYVVFHQTHLNNAEVFTMGYAGDEKRNISQNAGGDDSSPDWEPDDSGVYCGGEAVPTD